VTERLIVVAAKGGFTSSVIVFEGRERLGKMT